MYKLYYSLNEANMSSICFNTIVYLQFELTILWYHFAENKVLKQLHMFPSTKLLMVIKIYYSFVISSFETSKFLVTDHNYDP